MKLRPKEPTARHEACRLALVDLLREYEDLGQLELLAIASALVGQLLAMQDQTAHTIEQLMDLIGKNMESGNQHVVEQLLSRTGGNA